MSEDKRQYMRFDIPLDVKVKTSAEWEDRPNATVVNFSRTGLCFVAKEADINLSDQIELRVQMPNEHYFIAITGDLAWKEKIDDSRCMAGMSFKEIDSGAKSDILNQAYEDWALKLHK